MKLKYKLPAFFILILLCLSAAVSSSEIAIPERPLNHVVDLAGIIKPDVESNLNQYLLELEQKTTAQMVILTIKSLEGGSLEDLSLTVAHDKWKLGQKGKDNGLLLLVSLDDRKYRFEVGYGLEGPLPDSLVGTIGRQYMVPYFQKGDYSTGIFAGSLAAISEIATEAGVEITGMPKLRNRDASRGMQKRKPTLLGSIFSILFFIGLIYMFIKHPRLLMLLLVMNMMGGRRSGWSGGGGFSGGSFGGGGGGGFGGGGASGGW